MRRSRIYVDQDLVADTSIEIKDNKAHYIQNVLRLGQDAPLSVFNGLGGEFEANLTRLNKRSVQIQLGCFKPDNKSSALEIDLGLCVLKRESMDLAIQKATELGVRRVYPLISENVSIAHKSIEKRQQHWQEIAISACEQSGLNLVPEISAYGHYATWLEQNAELKLIADLAANNNLLDLNLEQTPSRVMVLVGPEGGFKSQETEAAITADFEGVYLGPRVLRAETATLTILALTQARWGDLK